ncbi:MAG TPA: hypothetical protein VGX25_21845 [Actinophytocola sp.]|uniref:hypothetical protein n=1 Tax=Actinophytocola sp. TaxID=1872138 RepID=UPI002DDC9FB1|nr:hypothetical protein [Actinophytocola sp.]HEV2782042.1 hypothetical protein [Actinophytocola sp.]
MATAVAAAADPTVAVAEERLSVGLAGPVGIVAVILGAGGLLIGLVRRRRTLRSAAIPAPRPTPAEPARTDTTV